MTSFYSIIKYVPDPLAGESINIGVVSFSGNQVLLKFVDNWSRARNLANHEPETAKSVARDLTDQLKAGKLDAERIMKFADAWQNQVQWTSPHASLKSVEDLFQDVVGAYLFERDVKIRKPGKRRAIKLAIDSLTSELHKNFHVPTSRIRSFIKTDYPAAGKLEQHSLDLAIVNGALKTAAVAVSFSQVNNAHIKRDIDAIAFVIEDIRKANGNLPLSVLAYSEGADLSIVQNAEKLFQNWNTKVITEKQVGAWSQSVVKSLPKNMMSH